MIRALFSLCLLLLVHSSAWALPDLNLEGELDVSTQLNFLPTSQQGNTAFSLQGLRLWSDVPLQDANAVEMLFEGAEKRDADSHRFDVQMKEAYLDLTSPFTGLRSMRYGLIPNSWQENQHERWDYDFLGDFGKAFTEKNGYISHSDLGVMYLSELADDKGEWSFAVTNGEGMESDEAGPRKDAQAFFEWRGWPSWALSLGYIYGAYDQYEASLGKKERILLQLTYEKADVFIAGLEWMDAHDPADTFSALKMAQGVDLTHYLGRNIHGQGGDLFLRWHSGPKAETILRYEQLQVVVGDKDKAMKTAWAGLSYHFTDDILAMAVASYSWFPEGYGLGSRNQSALQLATKITF
jgi:hypothetical protein